MFTIKTFRTPSAHRAALITAALALVLLALLTPPAWAQDEAAGTAPQPQPAPQPAPQPQPESTYEIEDELIVTGTYIKASTLDEAVPISTITGSDLEDRGSPSMVEFIQKLEFSTGRTHGQTNQFQNNFGEGIASVNLRGLGAQRTLVLINGHRQVASPFRRGFVDINQIPVNALARVEILKEGASATYGSDAIAGVVNFITDNRFTGLQLRADYQTFSGSDGGDERLGLKFGRALGSSGSTHAVVSAQYSARAALHSKDTDWALRDYNDSLGYSSIGNPGALMQVERGEEFTNKCNLQQTLSGCEDDSVAAGAKADAVTDPECERLAGSTASISRNRCAFQYLAFDNIISKEVHTSALFELTHDFANSGAQLRANLLYAHTDVPEWFTSPSYPPQELLGLVQYVPAAHPGLQDMLREYSSAYTDASKGIDNPFAEHGGVFWGRVVGTAGQPVGQPRVGTREYESTRFAVSFAAPLRWGSETRLDASIVHASQDGKVQDADEPIANVALAFRGYGGPNCGARAHLDANGDLVITNKQGNVVQGYSAADRTAAGTNDEECLWYNPFSNAIPYSQVTEAGNPKYNPAVANDPDLIRWLSRPHSMENSTSLMVAEAVLSGQTGVELGGGGMGWAAGVQLRTFSESLTNSRWNDLAATPCSYSWNGMEFVDVTAGDLQNTDSNCIKDGLEAGLESGLAGGPFGYLAASGNYDESQSINAIFGELALPFSDALNIQLALRFEDYGSVGDSLDPKISLRYEVSDWLALRASAASTFRGPVAYESSTARFSARRFIADANAFKAVDTFGNPDIQPETARTTNIGVVLSGERSELSLDAWWVMLSDPIVIESHSQIISRYKAAYGAAKSEVDKQTADAARKAAWQQHFTSATAAQITCGGVGGAAPRSARALIDSNEDADVPCASDGLTRVTVHYVNGPETDVAGFDLRGRLELGGGLETGISASYLSQYEVDAYVNTAGEQIAAAGEYVGTYNFGVTNPLPRWKARLWLRQAWVGGAADHNLNVQLQHIPEYDDDERPSSARFAGNTARHTIESMTTIDAVWRAVFGGRQSWAGTLAIYNLLDSDPPKVLSDMGYDSFTHPPAGRMIKVGAQWRGM
ncbi:MAG: TonB-dependent receptor [Gammaproteobacteria bacterium AqS3]|nr:TonB-dependent receptor [Gammaproteobacteria bacterium AqS3]